MDQGWHGKSIEEGGNHRVEPAMANDGGAAREEQRLGMYRSALTFAGRGPTGSGLTVLPMVDMTRRGALVTVGTMVVQACGRPKWLSDRAREGDRMDAVASSRQGLSVRFENDRVRVLELRLLPGECEGMHTHPQYVLYALTDYRVKNTNADGTVRVFERKRATYFGASP